MCVHMPFRDGMGVPEEKDALCTYARGARPRVKELQNPCGWSEGQEEKRWLEGVGKSQVAQSVLDLSEKALGSL